MAVLEAVKLTLRQELDRARQYSDRLFSILKPDGVYERPIAQRHRVIFYIGHLEAFDAIQICREGLGIPSAHQGLDNLFQAGIDPPPGQLPSDVPSDWPTLPEVKAYVERCRAKVNKYLDLAPDDAASMSLEHRLMHIETLAYMFHNFELRHKNNLQGRINPASTEPIANPMIRIERGTARLGKPHDGTFGWDNEYEAHNVDVPAFRIQKYKVTNRDYLRFVEEGVRMPHFWVERNGAIYYRGMFGEIPLPLDWPVYVTQRQAEAYANWVGLKLPSEAQFHRAAYGSPSDESRPYPWGNESPTHEHGNFDFKSWEPEPVWATPKGNSAFDVSQLVGNGWEWTRTEFHPFPGFQPRKEYPGYSANFFDGDHYVLKGGSCQTASILLRASFRNWFRRDYPYTYATFRCVGE